MKWVILIVVVILAAPTIANRLQALDPDNPAAESATPQRRRGLLYRAVRRFGLRRVFIVFVLILAILAVGVYLLIRQI